MTIDKSAREEAEKELMDTVKDICAKPKDYLEIWVKNHLMEFHRVEKELAEAKRYIEKLSDHDFLSNYKKLEAQVAKYRKALQPFVDNYDRYGNHASFSHGLFIKAKQALEEGK